MEQDPRLHPAFPSVHPLYPLPQHHGRLSGPIMLMRFREPKPLMKGKDPPTLCYYRKADYGDQIVST